MNGYSLQFRSPSENFDPDTILSQSENRQALQAALTAMLQKDPLLVGAIIEVNATAVASRRKREQLFNITYLTVDLHVISNRPCASTMCLNQFQSRTTNFLAHRNRTTAPVRYRASNTSEIYWLNYRFPRSVQASESHARLDSHSTIRSIPRCDIDQRRRQSCGVETRRAAPHRPKRESTAHLTDDDTLRPWLISADR